MAQPDIRSISAAKWKIFHQSHGLKTAGSQTQILGVAECQCQMTTWFCQVSFMKRCSYLEVSEDPENLNPLTVFCLQSFLCTPLLLEKEANTVPYAWCLPVAQPIIKSIWSKWIVLTGIFYIYFLFGFAFPVLFGSAITIANGLLESFSPSHGMTLPLIKEFTSQQKWEWPNAHRIHCLPNRSCPWPRTADLKQH